MCLTCIYCGKTDHSIDNCSDYRILDVNKRWDWACEKKLCFACLKSRHRRDRCRSKKKCATCKRGHHSLLHRDDWHKGEDKKEGKPECSYTTANVWDQASKKVYLKVLPVTVEGPAGSMSTFALLDECFFVAEIVGVEGPVADLKLHGAVGDNLCTPSHRVSLTLHTSEGTHKLDNVRTVDNLTLPTQSLDCIDLASLPHLTDIPIQTFRGKPTMIIGQDYWYLIVSRQLREGRKNEPVASLTRLGWVLHGFAAGKRNSVDYSCHLHDHQDDSQHDWGTIGSIGVKRDDSHRNSSEERRVLDIADYEKQVVNMPRQHVMGLSTNKRLWFSPNFGVRNPNKPGKLWPVFDAKAQTNRISLNTELRSGLDILNSLLGWQWRPGQLNVADGATRPDQTRGYPPVRNRRRARCRY
ncbi:uncharacterized protein [Choristoneura fumiferana]|uniref:uncharacterized protein n=1 Tax=Choristoneura fumiferana TaxID=7141 RepID=UPI003D1550C8